MSGDVVVFVVAPNGERYTLLSRHLTHYNICTLYGWRSLSYKTPTGALAVTPGASLPVAGLVDGSVVEVAGIPMQTPKAARQKLLCTLQSEVEAHSKEHKMAPSPCQPRCEVIDTHQVLKTLACERLRRCEQSHTSVPVEGCSQPATAATPQCCDDALAIELESQLEMALTRNDSSGAAEPSVSKLRSDLEGDSSSYDNKFPALAIVVEEHLRYLER